MNKFDTIKKLVPIIIFTILLSNSCFAQKKPQFGFNFKYLIPSALFEGIPLTLKNKNHSFSIEQKIGTSFGGFIRKSIGYKNISFETGIYITTRHYSSIIKDSFSKELDNSSFRFISYEIPINGLIFIQLSEKSFIDNSFGFSFDFQPSDLLITNENATIYTRKKLFILPALNAGTGYELRLKNTGSFYAGITYHRMLSTLGYTKLIYKPLDVNASTIHSLSGHYFSIDLRYLFPTAKERITEEDLNNN